jgi:hypothetical protein
VLLWHLLSIAHRFRVLGDFYHCKLRSEVVLAARWRRRANMESPIDWPTTVCYSCSFDIYRLSLTDYVFYAIFAVWKGDRKSFWPLGGATDEFWCNQSIPQHWFSIGSLLMFFVWHAPYKNYSTFSAVLRNLAVNLPLKQAFVSLTPVMNSSLRFYYCTLCSSPRSAF